MSTHLGNNYWLIVGPLVVLLAIVFWIFLTLRAARKGASKVPRGEVGDDRPHRGAVQGGIIEGDPGQRNRRDEAPRQS